MMIVRPGNSDDDCVSTGKDRADRRVQSENRFDCLQLDVKCPETAVLLLKSRERSILIAAAGALTKFAAKGKDHQQRLFELDVVDSLMPLIDHHDLATRRFAMRLLAEMAPLPFVKNHLIDLPSCISYLTKTLSSDPDMFVQEYASLILAEISKEAYGTVKLLEQCSNFDFLFDKIKQPDADIKKNSIDILDNLLKDYSVAAENIVAIQAFSFPLMYNLLDEPHPAIQTAGLSVIKSLVMRCKDKHIYDLFQQSNGLGVLLHLLQNDELINLHSDVLSILIHVAPNPKTIQSLSLDGGVTKLINYLNNKKKSQQSQQILDVLVRLANTDLGRKTLHDFGIISILLENLNSSRDSELRRIACYGIGMMSQHEPAAKEIMLENPIKIILDLMKDESTKWQLRETAGFALKQLCVNDKKNCIIFLDVNGQACCHSLLMQPFGKVSLEIALTAVDILTTIGANTDLRERLIQAQLIDALCFPFEAKDRAADEVKIACCKALSLFCIEKRAKKLCLANNVVKNNVYGLLQDSESIPVRAAAVQLVQQLCGDYVMTEQFVHAGFLNYMLKNRSASAVVPSWQTCIEALFSAHLPAKFAATGRLSFLDVTQDGFYVMHRHICPFPILNELFRLKMCPMEPIYVVNFAEPAEVSFFNEYGKQTSRPSVSGQNSFEASSAWLDVKFGTLQTDPYLHEYLEIFKCMLAANDADETDKEIRPIVVNISKLALRAQLLGIFVARQMSGPDPGYRCLDHQLEVHLQEIREDLRTSIIPLGQLRVGSYFERALLFKVMADRICLPAALVRGEYGKSWIEIPIPQIENPVKNADTSSRLVKVKPRPSIIGKSLRTGQRKSSENLNISMQQEDPNNMCIIENNFETILPTRLLCENYIVDLFEKPGDLIPMESARARTYCSRPRRHCHHHHDQYHRGGGMPPVDPSFFSVDN